MKRDDIYTEMDIMVERLREFSKSPFISHEEQDYLKEVLGDLSHASTFIYCTLLREIEKEH